MVQASTQAWVRNLKRVLWRLGSSHEQLLRHDNKFKALSQYSRNGSVVSAHLSEEMTPQVLNRTRMTHILSYSTKKPMEGPLLAQVLFECNLKVHVQSFTETDGRTISFASFPNQTGAITPTWMVPLPLSLLGLHDLGPFSPNLFDRQIID